MLKKWFAFLQKVYRDDKAGDHLVLRQHIDLSTVLFHSTEPDKPLITAAIRGDHRITLVLALMLGSAVCMLSLLRGCCRR